jgi:hypothetical protein
MKSTVTKADLYHVAHAYPSYHLGSVFQEIIEIFDDGKEFTLEDLLSFGGEKVWHDNPAIYISEEEWQRMSPKYRELHPMKKVGDKYEFIPRRIFKYSRYLEPLYYGAIACRNVKSKRVIVMVTNKISQSDYGYYAGDFYKTTPGWDGSTNEQKTEAEQAFNEYLKLKQEVEHVLTGYG